MTSDEAYTQPGPPQPFKTTLDYEKMDLSMAGNNVNSVELQRLVSLGVDAVSALHDRDSMMHLEPHDGPSNYSYPADAQKPDGWRKIGEIDGIDYDPQEHEHCISGRAIATTDIDRLLHEHIARQVVRRQVDNDDMVDEKLLRLQSGGKGFVVTIADGTLTEINFAKTIDERSTDYDPDRRGLHFSKQIYELLVRPVDTETEAVVPVYRGGADQETRHGRQGRWPFGWLRKLTGLDT